MMDERIAGFLSRHHVMTLATTDDSGRAWCSNEFYAFDSEQGMMIFTSDMNTAHAAQMSARPEVAASVVLETRIVGRVQGCQIRGRVVAGDDCARRRYLRRFPYAAAMLAATEVWALTIDYVKFTDNTLGFGKKLIWQRDTH